jgi:hypothetical protein
VYILGSGRWRYINKNDGELFLACSVIYIKAMAGPGVLYVLPARKLRKIRWAFNNLHAAHLQKAGTEVAFHSLRRYNTLTQFRTKQLLIAQ